MKHIKVLLLFFICLIPLKINGYTTNRYYINARVESNGDLVVEEYYDLNGSYNGSLNTILYENLIAPHYDNSTSLAGYSDIYNGSGITINKVMSVSVTTTFDFDNMDGDLFEEVLSADKGDYGVYTNEYVIGGRFLTIFMPDYHNKGFYIKYTIHDIAVKHNDVGELWWKRFDKYNQDESIGDLQVRITIPNNSGDLLVWAHGPLNGLVNKEGNTVYTASIDGMSAHEDVSFRMTFSPDVISLSPKITGVDGLPKILAYEDDSAGEANYQRETIEKENERSYVTFIEECKENPSHNCYDPLVELNGLIINQEFLKTYEDDFLTIQRKVIDLDRDYAIAKVQEAEDTLDYDDYLEAQAAINILASGELKQNLIKRLDDVYNKIEQKEMLRSNIYSFISAFLAGASIVLTFITFRRSKDYKRIFDHEYYRDIPDINVSDVSYLLNRKIDSDTISAELLNLVENKTIKVTKLSNDNYKFEIDKETKDGLKGKEKYLTHFIFDDNYEIELKELKKHSHQRKYYVQMNRDWRNFESTTRTHYNSLGVRDKDNNSRNKAKTNGVLNFLITIFFLIGCFTIFLLPLTVVACVIIGIIKLFINSSPNGKLKAVNTLLFTIFDAVCILLLVFLLGYNKIYTMGIGPIILSMVIIIVMAFVIQFVNPYTDKGLEYLGKLMGLKKFLLDFSIIDQRELPEVALWGKYMSYAMVLGISKKLAKDMKIRFEEMNLDYVYDFDTFTRMDYIGRHIYTSGSTARNEYITHTSSGSSHSSGVFSHSSFSSGGSSFSSGGGGGGGFSSHSSGGGGGGGSGRF